jgi:AAA domain-containing protein
MNNPDRAVIKDVTEARDKAGKLTQEMISKAIVPFPEQPEPNFGDEPSDVSGSAKNGKKPPPLAEELGRDFGDTESREKKLFLEVLRPSELKDYHPPAGIILVGDNHITRGSVVVIGGAPGVGKSRASVALAEAGATGYEWFNLKVHSKFKTLIVQNENGRFRLKQEFAELECEALEDYVRVTPPPPYGLCFDRPEFRVQLAAAIESFLPDVVIFDPWNAASRDEKARSMLETFESIRSVIPAGDSGPAIGIVAHTRKPQPGERSSGRALLNLLAGSYVLGSVPRCVFVMQAASDDVADNRIVWTCCKNNDGELGKPSAWERRNGLFAPVDGFDWEAFNNPEKGDGPTWQDTKAIVSELGEGADRKGVISELKERGASKSAAYRHLETAEKRGVIRLNPRTKIYEIR